METIDSAKFMASCLHGNESASLMSQIYDPQESDDKQKLTERTLPWRGRRRINQKGKTDPSSGSKTQWSTTRVLESRAHFQPNSLVAEEELGMYLRNLFLFKTGSVGTRQIIPTVLTGGFWNRQLLEPVGRTRCRRTSPEILLSLIWGTLNEAEEPNSGSWQIWTRNHEQQKRS